MISLKKLIQLIIILFGFFTQQCLANIKITHCGLSEDRVAISVTNDETGQHSYWYQEIPFNSFIEIENLTPQETLFVFCFRPIDGAVHLDRFSDAIEISAAHQVSLFFSDLINNHKIGIGEASAGFVFNLM